jgi:hypothetical protein
VFHSPQFTYYPAFGVGETLFNGTPAQFFAVAHRFELDRTPVGNRPPEPLPEPNPNAVSARMYFLLYGPSEQFGYAEAVSAPGGKSLINVYACEGLGHVIAESWQPVRAELERQGWIVTPIRAGALDSTAPADAIPPSLTIAAPLDVIDAAIDKCLGDQYPYGGYSSTRPTPASVTYRMQNRYVGAITARKLTERSTELSFYEPTKPYLTSMTPEQFEREIANWEMPSFSVEQKRERLRQVIAEQIAAHAESVRTHESIRQAVMSRLRADGLGANASPPLYTGPASAGLTTNFTPTLQTQTTDTNRAESASAGTTADGREIISFESNQYPAHVTKGVKTLLGFEDKTDSSNAAPGTPTKRRELHIGEGGQPGRPIYDDDDWAYEQIMAGRNKREVFREWQVRPRVLARPSNDWDVFCAAIRRRAKKARATKPTKR